jgi:AraC-like DNA-binding protein
MSSQRITVQHLGLDTDHDLSYVCDRPHGFGQGRYLFMRFNTPVVTRTVEGIIDAGPDDCLIHDPSFPQYLTARQGVRFRNDWIVFTGPVCVAVLRRYGLALNRILKPRQTHYITPLIRDMNAECGNREEHWQDMVHRKMEDLLCQLSRYSNPAAFPLVTVREWRYLDRFRSCRNEMMLLLHENWTVDRLACKSELSANRFAVLYKKFFGISPIEDLLRARLNHAKHLLRNTHVSVGEVAQQCGFCSIYYFSRLFRKRVGCAPREFYRMST